jgi:hypothetical protein
MTMGMVRINYEQMEQLRECSAEMQKPLSRLVAEAVNHWLAVVAPAKLGALRSTPPIPVSGERAQQLLKLIEIGGDWDQRGLGVVNGTGTRTGLAMLRWLVHGVFGAEGIRDLLRENRVENPHRALGEALFNVEGGCIRGELIYGPLCHLEQKVYAHQFGLSLQSWLHLQSLLERALADGVIDRVREDVLDQRYGSLFGIECNWLHKRGSADLESQTEIHQTNHSVAFFTWLGHKTNRLTPSPESW